MTKIQKTLKEKLLSRINKTETCWLWTGHCDQNGYGRLLIGPNRKDMAHRLSYTLFIGPIPDGLYLLHSCDNPTCVNPDHLRPGTHDNNMNDMVIRGRSLRGEKHNISKLKNDDVRIIRLLAKEMTHTELARMFNVSIGNISHIISGRNWSHLK